MQQILYSTLLQGFIEVLTGFCPLSVQNPTINGTLMGSQINFSDESNFGFNGLFIYNRFEDSKLYCYLSCIVTTYKYNLPSKFP